MTNSRLQLRPLLEEYSSLRKECVAAIGYRVQVLAFTFASLSVVVAGLLTRNLPDLLSGILSLFVLPQIAKAALLMWLGEYNRSVRASRYLRKIEDKVNHIIELKTMGWETELAASKGHMSYAYVAVVLLILGIGYVASALGIFLLSFSKDGTLNPKTLVILLIYFAFIESISLAYFFYKWDRIRRL